MHVKYAPVICECLGNKNTAHGILNSVSLQRYGSGLEETCRAWRIL